MGGGEAVQAAERVRRATSSQVKSSHVKCDMADGWRGPRVHMAMAYYIPHGLWVKCSCVMAMQSAVRSCGRAEASLGAWEGWERVWSV